MSRLYRLLSLLGLGLWLLSRRTAPPATSPPPTASPPPLPTAPVAAVPPSPSPLTPRLRKPFLWAALAVTGAVCALLFQLALGADVNYNNQEDTPPVTIRDYGDGGNVDVKGIYKAVAPSVIEVDASDRLGDQANPNGDFHGTAFVIDRKARQVATNFHVVDGARQVFVVLPGGTRLPAEVRGSDPSIDFAILEIGGDAELGPALKLGDSSLLEVGDPIVAIGNPLGLVRSISLGIVSALDRQLRAPNNFTIGQVIEIDAAIDHGSSGGPLLNKEGQVVGITTALAAEGSQFGFAVPSNAVSRAMPQVGSGSEVDYAWIGVQVEDVTPGLADSLNLPAERGALLVSVEPGGPAAKADLRGGDRQVTRGDRQYTIGGDLVVEIDGEKVRGSASLISALEERRPGQKVRLRYWRAGQLHSAEVKLGTRPDAAQTPAP